MANEDINPNFNSKQKKENAIGKNDMKNAKPYNNLTSEFYTINFLLWPDTEHKQLNMFDNKWKISSMI